MEKMVEALARAGTEIFDKLEQEPHKNGPAPQHWKQLPVCLLNLDNESVRNSTFEIFIGQLVNHQNIIVIRSG
jgi:hypothetical protein